MSGFADTGIVHGKHAASQIYFAKPRSATATGTAVAYWLLLLFLAFIYAQLPLMVPAVEPLRPVYAVGGLAIMAVLLGRTLSQRGWVFVWPESHLILGFVGA